MNDEKEPEILKREYKVVFVQGPYEGRTGILPFLPAFIALHEMDGDWGSNPGGGITIDTRLSEYVYMLVMENEDYDNDTLPVRYWFRPAGVDVRKYFRPGEIPKRPDDAPGD